MTLRCLCCDTVFSPAGDGTVVAHGLCPECHHAFLVRRRVPLGELLDRIRLPVIAMDEKLTALRANRAAEQAVGQPVDLIRGSLAGEVFECIHATAPGGCGRAIHCSGCTIRRAVAATHRDGRPRHGLEVEQLAGHGGERRLVRFRISTEKFRDSVLVVIEDASMLSALSAPPFSPRAG